MKLYYSPGACSLSPHIVLRELGLPFTPVKVDLKSKRTADGADYLTINGKGYVPALELDDGQVLTEGPAIVQYLADRKPEARLAPPNGTLERYRLQEWLNFISTELHKQFSPLFAPNTPDATKEAQRERLANRFDWLSKQLAGKQYLLGNDFSVADAYLFTVLNWCGYVGLDLAKWPVLAQYHARVAARPAVREALKAEGLAK
ncbi:MAG TPA: glutathione transferase GstA [Burkholderiaceae bacterium]|jgi:glutathione S-transferase|nr:glutathione transferase GstA [Burkholderiaceae bacterium]